MTKATLIALPVIILATILPATSGPRASAMPYSEYPK